MQKELLHICSFTLILSEKSRVLVQTIRAAKSGPHLHGSKNRTLRAGYVEIASTRSER